MSGTLRNQRGAVTLLGALFIIITLVLMLEVLHRSAGSDILDTALHNSSIQALYLAESGLEHAAARLGSADCDAGLAGTYSLANGTFTIEDLGAGFQTDFFGVPLPATDCRIRVTGHVPALDARRVVEARFRTGGNLLASANADFNEPAGTCDPGLGCYPTGWNLPAGGWHDTAGADGMRVAQVLKNSSGSSVVVTSGSIGLDAFTVTAPADLTLTFDYHLDTSGGGSSAKADFAFAVWDGTTLYSAPTMSINDPTSGFETGSVIIPITGSGTVTITEFRFNLRALSGQPKTILLDNLDLQGPGGGGDVTLLQWREIVSN